jgi:hypothetical protein
MFNESIGKGFCSLKHRVTAPNSIFLKAAIQDENGFEAEEGLFS